MSHIHDNPPPVGVDPAQSRRQERARREAERHFAGLEPQWLRDRQRQWRFDSVLTAVTIAIVCALFALRALVL